MALYRGDALRADPNLGLASLLAADLRCLADPLARTATYVKLAIRDNIGGVVAVLRNLHVRLPTLG